MKVYLDDAEIAVVEQTLSAALAAGASQSEQKGRIIVEVWADGSPAPEAHLSVPPDACPYAEEIRLVSAEPRALVQIVLLDVAEALNDARGSQKQAAEHLQIGKTPEALAELGDVFKTWQTVRQAVEEGCALLNISLDGERPSDPPFDLSIVSDLADMLTSIKDALADEDWPLLADLLAYDLDEHAGRWREELTRLSDSIAKSS